MIVTDQHQQQFREEGYFFLEKVVPNDILEVLRNDCDAAVELRDVYIVQKKKAIHGCIVYGGKGGMARGKNRRPHGSQHGSLKSAARRETTAEKINRADKMLIFACRLRTLANKRKLL